MPIPTGVKVGVLMACVLVTGYFTYKNMAGPVNENEEILNNRIEYFRCGKNHEFNMPAKDSRRIASDNGGVVVCPECNGSSSEVFPCSNCKKMVDFVGHGMIPDKCPYCKQKM
jgi:Zn finger protein HypA/HybF involved in hydrogenase expression